MNICRCKGVSAAVLKELIEMGVESWTDASEMTGAGRYCGHCIKRMRAIFESARARRGLNAA